MVCKSVKDWNLLSDRLQKSWTLSGFLSVSIQQSYCGQLNLTALVRLAFFLTHLPCVCVTESTLAAEEDFLDSFLSDLIDSSDDGKPAGPEPPTPPKLVHVTHHISALWRALRNSGCLDKFGLHTQLRNETCLLEITPTSK